MEDSRWTATGDVWVSPDGVTWLKPTPEQLARARAFYTEYRSLCERYRACVAEVDYHKLGVYVDDRRALSADEEEDCYFGDLPPADELVAIYERADDIAWRKKQQA